MPIPRYPDRVSSRPRLARVSAVQTMIIIAFTLLLGFPPVLCADDGKSTGICYCALSRDHRLCGTCPTDGGGPQPHLLITPQHRIDYDNARDKALGIIAPYLSFMGLPPRPPRSNSSDDVYAAAVDLTNFIGRWEVAYSRANDSLMSLDSRVQQAIRREKSMLSQLNQRLEERKSWLKNHPVLSTDGDKVDQMKRLTGDKQKHSEGIATRLTDYLRLPRYSEGGLARWQSDMGWMHTVTGPRLLESRLGPYSQYLPSPEGAIGPFYEEITTPTSRPFLNGDERARGVQAALPDAVRDMPERARALSDQVAVYDQRRGSLQGKVAERAQLLHEIKTVDEAYEKVFRTVVERREMYKLRYEFYLRAIRLEYEEARRSLWRRFYDQLADETAKFSPNPRATSRFFKLQRKIVEFADNEFAFITKAASAALMGDVSEMAGVERDLDRRVCDFAQDVIDVPVYLGSVFKKACASR